MARLFNWQVHNRGAFTTREEAEAFCTARGYPFAWIMEMDDQYDVDFSKGHVNISSPARRGAVNPFAKSLTRKDLLGLND